MSSHRGFASSVAALACRRTWGIVAVSILLAGCAPPPRPVNVVAGSVTYGGEPVREGNVCFLGPGNKVATGVIQPDGTYRIENPPLGKVRVGVACYPRGARDLLNPELRIRPGQAASPVPAAPELRLPARYADPLTSPLTLEVEPGEGTLDVHLAHQPGDPPVLTAADLPAAGVEVGQTAPEISGEDLDGKPFKLSDHRGKVVVLLFWGHWCTLCRERYAHDRELAERFKGRPFVMLGVNSDEDRSVPRSEEVRRQMSCRSWWEGSVAGPVASAWRIQGLPYLVLIDQEGVIRGRNVRGEELVRAVEQLLESKQTPKQ